MSDQAHGVDAEAKAANAAGVLGRNDNSKGVGVDGLSNSGVAVRAITSKGTAVFAEALSGRAVDASNFSLNEPVIRAITGVATAVDAATFGAPGVNALGKTGVAGASLSAPDASDPKIGAGVFGLGVAGAGVCGMTLGGTGVRGIGIPAAGAWAGHFQGNVLVQGILMKLISLFSIDHPLDPERKVLNHASVEAPEYKTFYDGVVTLDGRGQARVKLPRWFEALNGQLRYQLTPLGSPAPDLHVAQEVKNGSFVIAGGRRGQRVCWQVTGVRRDAWAEANPLKVEQPKRQARPKLTAPSLAELKRIAAAARKDAADRRREIAQRKRAANARRPVPSRISPPPPPAPPKLEGTPRKLAEQAVAALKRLMP